MKINNQTAKSMRSSDDEENETKKLKHLEACSYQNSKIFKTNKNRRQMISRKID